MGAMDTVSEYVTAITNRGTKGRKQSEDRAPAHVAKISAQGQ